VVEVTVLSAGGIATVATPAFQVDKHRRHIMAAKKNRTQATSQKTKKGRQTQAAPSEAVPTEALLQDQLAAAESVPAPATPTPELSRTVTPMPAEGEIPPPERTPSDQTEKTTKLSALDAAAKVLGETDQAMNCQELIAAMAAQGYWSSPKGRTPASTLYAALLRELKTKGEKARFIKTARGKFLLNGAR
jgi:HB1, ASXL, restriction endonuclease HTH domain